MRASFRGTRQDGALQRRGAESGAIRPVRADGPLARLLFAGLVAGLLAGCETTTAGQSDPPVGIASAGAPLQIAPLPLGSAPSAPIETQPLQPQPLQSGLYRDSGPRETGSLPGAATGPSQALAPSRSAPISPSLAPVNAAPGLAMDDPAATGASQDNPGPVSADCQRGDAAYWQGCADLRSAPKLIPGRYTREGQFVPSDRRR